MYVYVLVCEGAGAHVYTCMGFRAHPYIMLLMWCSFCFSETASHWDPGIMCQIRLVGKESIICLPLFPQCQGYKHSHGTWFLKGCSRAETQVFMSFMLAWPALISYALTLACIKHSLNVSFLVRTLKLSEVGSPRLVLQVLHAITKFSNNIFLTTPYLPQSFWLMDREREGWPQCGRQTSSQEARRIDSSP